jgi:CRISPR-associated protein Cas1
MIKRTIFIGNASTLRTKNEQLLITTANEDSELKEEFRTATVPIEDIAVLIIDNPQVLISHALISKLLENNIAFITCNRAHHPTGMLLNLDGNTLQSQKFKHQLEVSVPLKKQLWQQTIQTKLYNQAQVLASRNHEQNYLHALCKQVKSGDTENLEAQGASYYWKHLFKEIPSASDKNKEKERDNKKTFVRDREGLAPNHLFNYGYAILRACVARSLVGSGLLPTLGIHHRNQYNAYCLADDIMEPYRPYVDRAVCELIDGKEISDELTKEQKKHLLEIPAMDVHFENKTLPLMNALQYTTSSLAKCYEGKEKKIIYPEMKL